MPNAQTKKLCFVIGPIGKDFSAERKHADLLLNVIIKEVLEKPDFDYLVRRADEDSDPGMINDRVITDILNADLVIADLTGHNPNVFYELGIRHLSVKPTIHITSIGTSLPFDNHGHRTIFVDLGDWLSITSVRQRLADHVRAIEAPGYTVSNPITQARATLQIRESTDPRDKVLAEFQERLSEVEARVRRHSSPSTRASVSENSWNAATALDTLENAVAELVDDADQFQTIYRLLYGGNVTEINDLRTSIIERNIVRATALHARIARVSKREADRFVSHIISASESI